MEYLTIVCRTDGKIVSVLASPMLEMPEKEGKVENTISAEEAYSYAKVMLQQKRYVGSNNLFGNNESCCKI